MKDYFDSFKENFLEKFGSPFAGTFIVTWSILHWKLLFTLFNFASDSTLEYKLKTISDYLEGGFCPHLLMPILYTLVSITIYHILNLVSSSIIAFFKTIAYPEIIRLIKGKSRYVERRTFDTVQKKFIEGQKKADQLEIEKSTAIEERDKKRAENDASKADVSKANEELAALQIQYQRVNTENGQVIFNNIFQGDWKLEFEIPTENMKDSESLSIVNNEYFKNGKLAFRIENITWNKVTRKLCFLKIDIENNHIFYNDLYVNDGNVKLSGTENFGWSKVVYSKIAPPIIGGSNSSKRF